MGSIRFLFIYWGIVLAAPACASEFGFESLRELIASHGIRFVEDLIEALPRDLRSHYTLVFASRSLQGASFVNPRAILFGSKADFIVTFNGDPAQRGYSGVETMEFNSRSDTFLFREIRFSGSGSDRVSVSDANPARCIACHGQPAKPIWDTLPTWPGVYGERYRASLSALELAGMRDFLAHQPTHARYRNLLRAPAFSQRDTYMSSARNAYDDIVVEPPNAQLSALLSTENTRAILSEMISQPAYHAHRYVLLAAAEEDCGRLAEFYPEAVRAAVVTSLQAFIKRGSDIDQLQMSAKSARLEGSGSGFRGMQTTEFPNVRFVAESGLDLTTHRWTLALERNTHDLAAPEGSLNLAGAIINAVILNDKRLGDLRVQRGTSSEDKYCKRIRHESVIALKEWYARHPESLARWIPERVDPRAQLTHNTVNIAATDPARPQLLDQCIECHTGNGAPALPFADPTATAQRLAAGNYPRGRLLDEILYRLAPDAGSDSMPRGVAINAAQRRALEDYFLALANHSSVLTAEDKPR